jgi:hypothetical protein
LRRKVIFYIFARGLSFISSKLASIEAMDELSNSFLKGVQGRL